MASRGVASLSVARWRCCVARRIVAWLRSVASRGVGVALVFVGQSSIRWFGGVAL
ncbi:hypothetical protein ACXZ9C_11340 [Streptococcus agalactiae]